MKKKTTFPILASAIFFLVACAASPLGRKQLRLVPNEQMTNLGEQAFQELKKDTRLGTDATINNFVSCVSFHLITALDSRIEDWEIKVFEDPQLNAFALPGNKIGVYSGILGITDTQDKLAAVLAHEIGHVIAEHGNERVSNALAVQGGLEAANILISKKGTEKNLIMTALGLGTQFGIILPYNRVQEVEADLIGLRLMAKAGFEPEASIDLWKEMKVKGQKSPPEFLSTHPSNDRRIEKIEQSLPAAKKIRTNSLKYKEAPRCKLA